MTEYLSSSAKIVFHGLVSFVLAWVFFLLGLKFIAIDLPLIWMCGSFPFEKSRYIVPFFCGVVSIGTMVGAVGLNTIPERRSCLLSLITVPLMLAGSLGFLILSVFIGFKKWPGMGVESLFYSVFSLIYGAVISRVLFWAGKKISHTGQDTK
jgi:hypothetical protein